MTRSIHRFAAEDLRDAARRYRAEAGVGLARRFLDEFERVARLLEEFPDIGTPADEGRRSFPLVGFPYTLIYRREADEIRILVVRHHSRDPDFGEARS